MDCSQTLYEFRASNPRALNVLEGSGVFETFQLQTNYRSNQEILDFANVALSDIEANQYANIQLQANSLSPVTEQSFTDKVHLKYTRINRVRDVKEDVLINTMATDGHDFIQDCLKRGEQVAVLAYTRQHVMEMQEIIEKKYPGKEIVNLIPEKVYNSTVFSSYIKCYWPEVKFIPNHSILVTVAQEIDNRLDRLIPYSSLTKARPAIRDMIFKWQNENRAIINAWTAQVDNGTLSQAQFLENVRDNMLDFEMRQNAVRQSLISEKNMEAKKENQAKDADFVFSTIHSAKGLEFDNVIVIYHASNDMSEEDKRMYYVAFTRAMNSELVIAYDTAANPKIQGDYDAIVKSLREKAASRAAVSITNQVNVISATADDDEPDDSTDND